MGGLIFSQIKKKGREREREEISVREGVFREGWVVGVLFS